MRKATLLLATVLSGLVVTSLAHAQQKPQRRASSSKSANTTTYKWVDEKGVTHYGDSVPAQYSQREQTLLNAQGVATEKRVAEMSPA